MARQGNQAIFLYNHTDTFLKAIVESKKTALLLKTESGERYTLDRQVGAVLLPGDIVEFTPPSGRGFVRRITELISRPSSTWLGTVHRHPLQDYLDPDEPLGPRLNLPSNVKADPFDVIQVQVPANAPVGHAVSVTVLRNLGPRNDGAFDSDYAKAKFGLPFDWPEAALRQAERLAQGDVELEAGEIDLRALGFVTIDGESTKDFDDAVFAQRTVGGFSLYVAIADVARYVAPGSPLDQEARRRGTSVYLPDQVLPMLPESLSNGLCSLKPKEDRHVLVCKMELDNSAQLVRFEFHRALIRSIARLTYGQVTEWLEDDAEGRSAPAAVRELLGCLLALHKAAEPQRQARGLHEVREREPSLRIGPAGEYGVKWNTAGVADEIVEECMLLANQAAATQIGRLDAAIYRHHQGLDPLKWADTRAWLQAHDIASPVAPSTEELRAALAAARELQLGGPALWRMQHSFVPAVYDSTRKSHFALSVPAYTHFTSPIRRYADLLVHRLLLGDAVPDLQAQAELCSAQSQRAAVAERYVMSRIKTRALWTFLAHEGEAPRVKLEGTVAYGGSWGLRVVTDQWGVFVFIPEAACHAAGYTWDSASKTWTREEHAVQPGVRLSFYATELLRDRQELELRGQLADPAVPRVACAAQKSRMTEEA